MMSAHDKRFLQGFIESVLPLRYELRGTGPRYDCQTFTQFVQSQLFGRTLPTIYLPNDSVTTFSQAIQKGKEELREEWIVISRPIHGCIIEMSHGEIPHHIGTWLDIGGGSVLHCIPHAGVCFDPMITLRAAGWRRFVYDAPR